MQMAAAGNADDFGVIARLQVLLWVLLQVLLLVLLQVLLHLTREQALHVWHTLSMNLKMVPNSTKAGCFGVHHQR